MLSLAPLPLLPCAVVAAAAAGCAAGAHAAMLPVQLQLPFSGLRCAGRRLPPALQCDTAGGLLLLHPLLGCNANHAASARARGQACRHGSRCCSESMVHWQETCTRVVELHNMKHVTSSDMCSGRHRTSSCEPTAAWALTYRATAARCLHMPALQQPPCSSAQHPPGGSLRLARVTAPASRTSAQNMPSQGGVRGPGRQPTMCAVLVIPRIFLTLLLKPEKHPDR